MSASLSGNPSAPNVSVNGGWALFGRLFRGAFAVSCVLLYANGLTADDSRESTAAPEIPEVVQRFEMMLFRSPDSQAAFSRVYDHFYGGAGLNALEARWKARFSAGDERYAAAFLLGLLADRRGDSGTAAEYLAMAAEERPSDFRAPLALGRLLARRGALTEAITRFEESLARNPPAIDLPDIYTELARTHQRNLDPAGALTAWKAYAAAFPGDPIALEEVAEGLVQAEQYGEAVEVYRELEGALEADPLRRLQVRLRRAEAEERRGNAVEALRVYRETLAQAEPGSWIFTEVANAIEAVYRREDDLAGLAAFYEAQLEAMPRETALAERLGRIHLERNAPDEALSWLERALSWSPRTERLQAQRAAILVELRRFDAAEAAFRELAEDHPDSWEYRERLGEVFWRRWEEWADPVFRDTAIEIWSGLITEEATTPTELNRLGDLFRRYGLADEAVARYEAGIAREPEAFDLRERLALYLFSLDRNTRAWAILAGAGVPQENRDLLRLAQFQKRYGKPDEALASITIGLEREPGDFSFLELKWRILFEEQRYTEAVALYPTLIAAAPNEYFLEDLEGRYVRLLRIEGSYEAIRARLTAKMAQPETLSEEEFRLLARMALDDRRQDRAFAVFEAADQAYPDSFLLARLEAEYLRRYAPVEEQVAGWRELARLRPLRRAEWLRQVVLTYRSAERLGDALRAARDVVEAYPADPQSHLLLADIAFAAGYPADGNGALREALRLAENQYNIRLRLARALTEQGSTAEAIDVYLEAFEEADNFNLRHALIRPLVELYLADGQLDNLLSRFESRLKRNLSTAEYYIYLGEIYQQAEDLPRAREALSEALIFRRDDPKLLNQLIALSRAEENAGEWVRFARLLARAEPTADNELSLAAALLASGEGEQALEIIARHTGVLLADTMLWREFYPGLAREGLLDRFGQVLLDSYGSGAEEDWRGMLALAEFFIIRSRDEEARVLLWRVLDIELEVIAPGMAAHAGPPPDPDDPFQAPMRTSQQARSAFQKLLTARLAGGIDNDGTVGSRGGATSLTEGQVVALTYLSGLAAVNDQSPLFTARLTEQLDELGSTRAGRILAYLQVRAREALLDEIAAMVENGEYDRHLYEFCHRVLTNTVYAQRAVGRDLERMNRLSGGLEAAILEREPDRAGALLVNKAQRMSALGRKAEAQSTLSRLHSIALDGNSTLAVTAARLFLDSDNRVVAEEILDTLLPATAGSGAGTDVIRNAASLAIPYAKTLADPPEAGPESMARLGNLIELGYRAKVAEGPVLVAVGGSATNRQELFRFFSLPTPTRFFAHDDINTYRQLFNLLRRSGRIDEAREMLAGQARSLDPVLRPYAQLLFSYFQWWAGDRASAQRIAESVYLTHRSDPLRILTAEMLFQLGKPGEALTRIEEIESRTGLLATVRLARMLTYGRETGDSETAREALVQLQRLRVGDLPGVDLSALAREYAISREEVSAEEKPAAQPTAVVGPRQTWSNVRDQLNKLEGARAFDEAEALARRILREAPLHLGSGQYSWVRREALRTLHTTGHLPGYLRHLERQLEVSPDSVRLLQLLAEAAQVADDVRADGRTRSVLTRNEEFSAIRLRLERNGGRVRFSWKRPSDPDAAWTSLGSLQVAPELPAWAGVMLAGRSDAEPARIELQDLVVSHDGSRWDDASWRVGGFGRESGDVSGDRTVTGSELTVESGRGRIGDEGDAGRFVYVPMAGDGSIEVTIAEPADWRRLAYCGISLRLGWDAGSPHASLALRAPGQLTVLQRSEEMRDSLEYFRRLAELRPSNSSFTDLLERRLQAEGRHDELADLYGRMLETSFFNTLHRRHQLAEIFLKAERGDELIRRLLEAEYPRPALSQLNGTGALNAMSLQRVGNAFLQAGKPGRALRIWQKALETVDPQHPYSLELRTLVFREIARTASPDSKADLLAPYFLPRASEEIDGLWMQRRFEEQLPAWLSEPRRNDGGPAIGGWALLQMAHDGETLELLGRRAESVKRASADLRDEVTADTLMLLIRLIRGDPALIEETPRWLAKLENRDEPIFDYYRSVIYENVVPVVVDQLQFWPGAEALCFDLLDRARLRVDAAGNLNARLAVRFQMLDFASEIGRQEAAVEVALEVKSILDTQALENNGNLNLPMAFDLLGSLLDLYLLPEAEALMESIEDSPQIRTVANYREQLTAFRQQLALERGEVAAVAPRVWIDPPQRPEGVVRVSWEIGIAPGAGEPDSMVPRVFGRSFSGVDGRYRLQVRVAAEEQAEPETILDLEQAPARGSVEVEPGFAPSGIVSAVLIRDNPMRLRYPGMKAVFTTGINRLMPLVGNPVKNPGQVTAEGWRIDPGQVRSRSGGVDGDTRYLRLRPQGRNDTVLEGPAIPVESRDSYLQAAWMRTDQNGAATLGRRYLDIEGRELKTSFTPVRAEAGRWTWIHQVLGDRAPVGVARDILPRGTAFIQPLIRVRNGVDLDGLYFGVMETERPESLPKRPPEGSSSGDSVEFSGE